MQRKCLYRKVKRPNSEAMGTVDFGSTEYYASCTGSDCPAFRIREAKEEFQEPKTEEVCLRQVAEFSKM